MAAADDTRHHDPVPDPLRLGRLTVIALVLVAVLFQVASLSRHMVNPYDEGLVVFGAQRVLEGDSGIESLPSGTR